MLESFTCATFAQHLGETFRIRIDQSNVVEVTLSEATERGAPASRSGGVPASAGQGESFSLVFRGPRDPFLPQGTYRFEHDHLGAFPLFIVPIGADDGGIRYQAVFNRLPRRNADPPR